MVFRKTTQTHSCSFETYQAWHLVTFIPSKFISIPKHNRPKRSQPQSKVITTECHTFFILIHAQIQKSTAWYSGRFDSSKKKNIFRRHWSIGIDWDRSRHRPNAVALYSFIGTQKMDFSNSAFWSCTIFAVPIGNHILADTSMQLYRWNWSDESEREANPCVNFRISNIKNSKWDFNLHRMFRMTAYWCLRWI